MRNVSDKNCRENQMSFVFSNFFLKIVAFMGQCVKISNSQTGHRCQHNTVHAHGTLNNSGKKTDTHADLIPTAFPQQQWLCKHASMLLYTYTACLVTLIICQHCSSFHSLYPIQS